MDHVPRPLNTTLPAIAVPYVAREDIHPHQLLHSMFSEKHPNAYNCFHVFRVMSGFSDERINTIGWLQCATTPQHGPQKFDKVPKVIAESFIQEWLFFGLLFEILREDFRRSDFIDETQKFITTTKLPKLLWKYKERTASMLESDGNEAKVRGLRVVNALDYSSRFFNNYFGKHSNQRPNIALDERLILSVGVLVGTLCATVDECTQKFYAKTSTTFQLTWPAIIDEQLLQNGWCPNALAMLERRGFGPYGMLYAAMLGPLNKRDHSKCHREDFECKANQVDESTYKPTHHATCKENECQVFPVNATKICNIIEESEDYPILEISSTSDGSYHAVAYQVSVDRPYVAFSHVWMDGLGNPLENELPIRQIKRLCNLVNSLPGKEQGAAARFWLDTLCVPGRGGPQSVPPVERREVVRTKAVSRILDVYKNAEAVIVLDANIFASKQTLCNASDAEVFMRLMSTNWMRRLWTLLEGVLGKKLYLAFPDGIVNLQERVNSLQVLLQTSFNRLQLPPDDELGQSVQHFPGEPVSRIALQQYVELRAVKEEGKDKKLALMWNNMMWRSTSWKKDETTCMAVALGFSPENLLELLHCQIDWLDPKTATLEAKAVEQAQLADRYQKFLLLLGELKFSIPRGIVFSRSDRFAVATFGWAPKFFFRTAASGVQIDGRFKGEFVENQGLYLPAAGFELYLPPTGLNESFTLIEEPHTISEGTFYQVDFSSNALNNTENVPWTSITSTDIKDPALLVADDVIPNLKPGHAAFGTLGVMVSITNRREELYQNRRVVVFYATLLGRVQINKIPSQMLNWDKLADRKHAARADAIKEGLMRRLYDRKPGAEPQPIQPPLGHDPERFNAEKTLWKGDAAALNYEFDLKWAVGRKIDKDQVWCISDALQLESG